MAAVSMGGATTKGRSLIRAWEESVGDVLSARSLRLTVETPSTLAEDPTYKKAVTTLGALEGLARESFVEDDYEGAMHALTLRREDRRVVGVLFWRDLHPDEMAEWLASSDLLLPPSTAPALPSSSSTGGEEGEDVFSGVLVTRAGGVEFAEGAESAVPAEWGSSSPLEGWVKIEIMGTREGEGGRGMGGSSSPRRCFWPWQGTATLTPSSRSRGGSPTPQQHTCTRQWGLFLPLLVSLTRPTNR